jgi:hypothetical protein
MYGAAGGGERWGYEAENWAGRFGITQVLREDRKGEEGGGAGGGGGGERAWASRLEGEERKRSVIGGGGDESVAFL